MDNKNTLSAAQAVHIGKKLVTETLRVRWKMFLFSIVCMLGVAGFTGALAYSTRLIVNNVFVDDNLETAFWVASLVIGVSIGKSLFQYANSVIGTLFNRSVSAAYQKRLFRHLLQKDVSFYHGEHASNQMVRIRIFGQAAGTSVLNICNKLLTDFLTLIALFTVMLLQDPLMTLASSVIIPLIFWLVANLSHRVRAAANAETAMTGAFFALGAEAMDGIKIVKSYQLEQKSATRFEKSVDALEERLLGIAKITSATVPIMEFLGGLVIGLFVIYAAWQTITYGKTPGEFTAFITAFLMAYQPAERVSKVWVDLQKTLVQTGRMFDLLDESPKVRTAKGASLCGSPPWVRFDRVSFAYRRSEPVLQDVSFEVHPGERIAIVGRSGAGKSTLIDLIQRFDDPTSGMVEIGGLDLRRVSDESARQYIALIAQDVFLFDDTIRENILDGNPGASDGEINRAVKLAQLDDVVGQMPKGLDTQVGPNGRALSGGQKQRVGIARALAKQASIFIFDEATSALDSQNERQIMENLREAMPEATLFFVTHRASTLAYVDRVMVLVEGRLTAFDTPERLMAENPEYKALFEKT